MQEGAQMGAADNHPPVPFSSEQNSVENRRARALHEQQGIQQRHRSEEWLGFGMRIVNTLPDFMVISFFETLTKLQAGLTQKDMEDLFKTADSNSDTFFFPSF